MDTSKGEKVCFAAFGAYVLTKDVFNRLDEAVRNNMSNTKGEIELTDALKYVCKDKGAMALLIDGRSYDLGNAKSYRKAVSEFGKNE